MNLDYPFRGCIKKTATLPAVGYACLALIAYYTIFHLPFRFPPTQRVTSDSYVFGFNNSVAIVSIVTLLAVITLIRFLRNRRFDRQADISFPPKVAKDIPRIPRSIYWFMALLYLFFTLTIYWKAQGAQFYSIDWESSYFLWRLKLMEIYGLRPYVDFQFDYGPALIYPSFYFHRLLRVWSVSPEASYYAFHYLANMLSLYCIFSLLNRTLMPSRDKKIVFGILGLASFAPYMGLNAISIRYLLPYLSLVIVHQIMAQALRLRSLKAFVLVFLASVINMLISAEIGLAFSLALFAYVASFFRTDLRISITSLFAFALALVFSRMFLPAPYYESLLSFSKGANNFPLLPAAHLLVYIVTLFLTVPRLMVAAILKKHASAPLLFGLGVLSIALIPGAFGRCDPLHVFFYGLGISLITFIWLANIGKKRFLLYAVAYTCVFIVGFQWSNTRVFDVSLESVLSKEYALVVASKLGFNGGREKNEPGEPRKGKRGGDASKLPHLNALDKYPQLGLPYASYGTDKTTETYLWMRKKIAPEYYMGAVGVYTEADLSRKLADLSRNEYLLLLRSFWNLRENHDSCNWRREYIRMAFIYPVTLSCKKEHLDMDLQVSRYIAASYRIVETVGDYIIVKRIS